MRTDAHHHFVPQTAGPVTVLRLTKTDLDDTNAQGLAEELFTFTDHFSGTELCLDMGSVAYLSSTALGKFISLNKKLRATGRYLRLVRVDPTIYELFSLTRLTTVLDVSPEGGVPALHARALA